MTNERRPQPDYKIGDQVLVTTHVLSKSSKNITSKFVPKRDGPYQIMKKIGTSSYQIASNTNPSVPLGTYHVSAFTLYKKKELIKPVQPLRTRGRPKKKINHLS